MLFHAIFFQNFMLFQGVYCLFSKNSPITTKRKFSWLRENRYFPDIFGKKTFTLTDDRNNQPLIADSRYV